MKKVLYIILIIGSLIFPIEKADIAKLEPVEAAVLHKVNNQVEMYTDTGAWGRGNNAQQALEDMLLNTPGVVYLDTAKYLLVDENMITQIEDLRDELKGSVRVCIWDGEGEIKEALRYFSVHGQLPKLKKWRQGDKLPEYRSKNIENGRKYS